MFGSNFSANFGIPDFPYQGTDPQGGLLASNISPAAPGSPPTPPGTPPAQPAPAAGLPSAPQAPSVGAPSPLGGGVLSPGSPQPQSLGGPTDLSQVTAPAAGVGSPFGKANV